MRKPAFTVEQLRSFLAVAEHQHVSKAAAYLQLTQSAVTQQVRNFERALGVHLLERDGRGVRLTNAGRALATTCRSALRALEVVEDSARAAQALEAGSLHLGASPTCASYYLPSRLARFSQRFPKVRLSVTVEPSSEINKLVHAGVIDCALIEGEPDPDLVAVILAHDEMVLVVHRDHPLARLRRVTTAQLSKHRYLGRGPSWSAEKNVRAMVGQAYDRSEVINLGHPEYVRAAAIAGLGYAALPILAVKTDLASGILMQLPVPSSDRAIRAIRRPSQGGPTLEKFWRHVTGEATTTADRAPSPRGN